MNAALRWLSLLMMSFGGLECPGAQIFGFLGNPTTYVFHGAPERVDEAIRSMDWIDRIRVVQRGDHTLHLIVFPQYSARYWSGRQETNVDTPEAGKIGQIEGDFLIRASRDGAGTRVTVEVVSLEQQIGRTLSIFPHFRKVPRMAAIKSDTYFEYLFLRRLGAVLGERDMPPLKDGS